MTGILRAWASTTSGFTAETAELATTTVAPATFRASCPSWIVAPIRTSRSVTGPRRRSEPETSMPRFSRISAMPLMPIPPIPIKCACCEVANMGCNLNFIICASCGCELHILLANHKNQIGKRILQCPNSDRRGAPSPSAGALPSPRRTPACSAWNAPARAGCGQSHAESARCAPASADDR